LRGQFTVGLARDLAANVGQLVPDRGLVLFGAGEFGRGKA
jgi:hypothetical protein